MIFDTHSHYDDEAFDTDRSECLARQKKGGVERIAACGADLETSAKALKLAQEYDMICAVVGIHPDSIGELDTECPTAAEAGSGFSDECRSGYSKLSEMAQNGNCVAIGEIGLDYHWDHYPRQQQKDGFIAQWRLAESLGLPVVIHSRDAAEDTFEIVRMMYDEYRKAGKPFIADMHCYSYSVEQAKEYLSMGLYFGIGGVLTFKNARKLTEVVRLLPMERILLETDCPYLAPEPMRGKRNESVYLKNVVEKLAELKDISTTEVERVTYENACRFYRL